MVKITQLSSREEWLENRKKYIGGSDAATVIGLNPYKNNVELWEEKTGRVEAKDISEQPYVKYGHDAEEHLRTLFALDFREKYAVGYIDNNSYYNDRFPWAAASLDGTLIDKETDQRGILEIKTTNILQSMQKEKWKNGIPDNYFCQVLHYLAVTEFDFVVLKAQLKSVFGNGEVYLQTKHYRIERSDVESQIDYLMQKEKKFYQYIIDGTVPPLVLPVI